MSENRAMFEESASRLLDEQAQPTVIEAAERGEFPQAMWDQMAELGLLTMLADEDRGGIAADYEDAGAVMRAAGFHAAPGPIVETMIGNWLLGLVGHDAEAGPVGLILGDGTPAGAWLRAAKTVVQVAGDRLLVLGTGTCVLGKAASGEPRDTLTACDPTEAHDIPGIETRARNAAALLQACQMVGALEWCVERSVDYVQERSQFGKPLAKLQVVQQYLAQAASELVAADALVGAATLAGPDAEALVAAARSRVAEATDVVSALCHQVHGAIGFSREYPLNFRTRRLLHWRDDYGTTVYWRRRLGAEIVAGGADTWAVVTRLMGRTDLPALA